MSEPKAEYTIDNELIEGWRKMRRYAIDLGTLAEENLIKAGAMGENERAIITRQMRRKQTEAITPPLLPIKLLYAPLRDIDKNGSIGDNSMGDWLKTSGLVECHNGRWELTANGENVFDLARQDLNGW